MLLLLEHAPCWGGGGGRKGKNEDGIQTPSGGLSLEVAVGAACGPGKGIWPLGMEAPSLSRGSGYLEDSAEQGVVRWQEQISAGGEDLYRILTDSPASVPKRSPSPR